MAMVTPQRPGGEVLYCGAHFGGRQHLGCVSCFLVVGFVWDCSHMLQTFWLADCSALPIVQAVTYIYIYIYIISEGFAPAASPLPVGGRKVH